MNTKTELSQLTHSLSATVRLFQIGIVFSLPFWWLFFAILNKGSLLNAVLVSAVATCVGGVVFYLMCELDELIGRISLAKFKHLV